MRVKLDNSVADSICCPTIINSPFFAFLTEPDLRVGEGSNVLGIFHHFASLHVGVAN